MAEFAARIAKVPSRPSVNGPNCAKSALRSSWIVLEMSFIRQRLLDAVYCGQTGAFLSEISLPFSYQPVSYTASFCNISFHMSPRSLTSFVLTDGFND